MGADVEELVRAVLRPPYPLDPYPGYAALRQAGPVVRGDDGGWLATTYETAQAVFRTPELGQGSGRESRLRQDERYEASASLRTLSFMLPFLDPPDHTRLRRLIVRAFTPRAVERMRAFVTARADQLLDDGSRGGEIEVMGDFADHIPVSVICEMLGAPRDRHTDLVRWADALVHAIHPTIADEDLVRADQGARAFRAYVDELVAARRAEPRGDLLTALVRAEEDGDALDAQELVSTVVVFIGAGIENTKHLIGAAIAWLLRHPEQLALVHEGAVSWADAVEEVLRLEPPVQVSLPRIALADVAVGDVVVRRGERISALIAAANRDPAVYEDPDTFDVRRQAAAHLSLASGAHYCTGAGLARLEATVAVERFLTRCPEAGLLDVPEIREDIRPSLRGYRSMRLSLGEAA